MTFKEWLFERLMDDEVIDDSWSAEELNYTDLYASTEFDDHDLFNYQEEYAGSCKNSNEEPVWDLD